MTVGQPGLARRRWDGPHNFMSYSPKVFLLLMLGATMPAAPAAWSAPSPGVRRMAERLEAITRASEQEPMKNQFLNHLRAKQAEAQLGPLLTQPVTAENATHRFSLQVRYATELLNSGESEKALSTLRELEQMLQQGNAYDAKPRAMVRTLMATASLRLGEQENCLKHHNSDSCLAPIGGSGVHTETRGSRGALTVLEQMLADTPGDMRARWLFNIAAMTLGEYPAKVPARWLIPPSAFASDYPLPRYPEIASGLGLDIDGHAGGVVMDDFDGDGHRVADPARAVTAWR